MHVTMGSSVNQLTNLTQCYPGTRSKTDLASQEQQVNLVQLVLNTEKILTTRKKKGLLSIKEINEDCIMKFKENLISQLTKKTGT